MERWLFLARVFGVGAVCAVVTPIVGCGAASTGHGGDGGAGGAPTCPSYLGVGCTPGDSTIVGLCAPEPSSSGGPAVCQLVPGTQCTTEWNPPCEPTPLVLSFDGAPVVYRTDHERAFDLDGTGSLGTDWPTEATPWLALDRDGSGAIEDGSELFGSMTLLAAGRRASNGFEALRELDTNGDGRITAEDASFARLLVWSDRDGDRRSSLGELVPATTRGLVSIDLAYTVEPSCDARGNCEVERAAFRFVDGDGTARVGAVIDVHLAPRR